MRVHVRGDILVELGKGVLHLLVRGLVVRQVPLESIGRATNTFKWDLPYYEAAYQKMKDTFSQFDKNVAAYMNAHK